MTLLEPLVAAVVFAAATTVSAQIWGVAGATSVRHGHVENLVDRLDAEVQAIDRQLRRQRQPAPLAQDCVTASAWLQSVAATIPVAADVSLRSERLGAGDQLLLEVAVTGLSEPRRRLYDPATMNLCGGAAPPAGPMDAAPPASGSSPSAPAAAGHGGDRDG